MSVGALLSQQSVDIGMGGLAGGLARWPAAMPLQGMQTDISWVPGWIAKQHTPTLAGRHRMQVVAPITQFHGPLSG